MDNAIRSLIFRLETIGDVTADDRAALASIPLRIASVPKGGEIVADGEMSTSCCLVVDGYIYRSKMRPDGKRQIFSLHPPGDIPDLHSLHLPRMDHNLAAMSDCTVARLAHADVKAVIEERPRLGSLLWRDTLIDAAAFRAWMLMLGAAEALERMAHLFCEAYTRASMAGLNEGNTFRLPLTQTDLSDILGISLVHANRTLQDLRSRGLMDFDQQVVTIIHWDHLRALAQFDPSYLHYLDSRVGRIDPAKM
ncbi:cAMP-binding domain of CRP or a regulatory subunit of cAMP-dependent protein kinases [Devosia crocina]|uniref:cAMP-binding domain of CRP or a regulatory subunit of cAMP-dependent protein kinases n=1 Tax=Devosia crocina TaxID=429728 RepID=A0A1I7MZZ5_9HYPH|nr:Crp/Fnr family transcriptional regulator [Devosia crocina]SFV27973.1 cAMP-binding domain of CRP or a regulatory subunit of cAMP-dependent protein kinases [Devosia crocina]